MGRTRHNGLFLIHLFVSHILTKLMQRWHPDTDLSCNRCAKPFCRSCLKRCRVCNTLVCKECWFEKSGICADCKDGKSRNRELWIERTKILYEGKLVRTSDFCDTSYSNSKEVDVMRGREQAVRDSSFVIAKNWKGNEIVMISANSHLIYPCFPVSKLVETEEDKLNFKMLLEVICKLDRKLMSELLILNRERRIVLDLLYDFLHQHRYMIRWFCKAMMSHREGGDALSMLIERGMIDLDWLKDYDFPRVGNVVAVDLCLKNCLDIEYQLLGDTALATNLKNNHQEVVDRLIKGGASFENAIKNIDGIKYQSLEAVLKNKGDDFIHQVPVELLLHFWSSYEIVLPEQYCLYYHMLMLLKRVRYNIPKEFFLKHENVAFIVGCMSFGYMKFEELNKKKREDVASWIRKNDVKVNGYTLPFLCNEIKERMMVLLLCVKRVVGNLGKDLRMMLLDAIWSPEELRG